MGWANANVFGVDIRCGVRSCHPLGKANAHLLTMGGRRIFISGDRATRRKCALTSRSAFVCMNQPYTMTVNEATNAVSAFRPAVVYPYHYRDQSGASGNATAFKQLLRPDLGVEVRLRKWY
jgi:L-ascorbate metabolism protein UlaG (beta-lactamase superfamily)